MTHKDISIPGGETRFEDSPDIRIVGPSGHPISLIIKYHCLETSKGQPPVFGEITFTDVLEYRWVDEENVYFLFPEENDYKYGLIEILNSLYVENLAAKGGQRDALDKHFGPAIEESSVRHFRLAFPQYGYFDIIARGVSTREVSRQKIG